MKYNIELLSADILDELSKLRRMIRAVKTSSETSHFSSRMNYRQIPGIETSSRE